MYTGHWSVERVRGMDGGMTDAASECDGQEPAACEEGRLRTHGRLGHLCCWCRLGGRRGMGSPTMHIKTWNWRQTRERTSLFWYHRGGSYRQIAWCDSCDLLSACDWCLSLSPHRLTGGSRYLLPAYMRVTNFCYIFGLRNGGRLICGTAYMRVYREIPGWRRVVAGYPSQLLLS